MGKFTRAVKLFRAFRKEAEAYHQHPSDAGYLARNAYDRAKQHRGPLSRVWDDLMTFFRLLRAWATGKYRHHIPWKSVAMIIAGVLYFMDPLDLIPDFIPIIGFADDAFIIRFVMRAIHKDVERFREWEGVLD
jgi:uncharacterized membrane protein YkvA (DUF1232 family)